MNRKRLVFCAFGSLGDIYPILALARGIKRRGHFPVVATNAVYRQLVESQGVEFHAVRPDVDVSDPSILRRAMDRRNGARYIFGELILPSIRETYEDTAAATRGADMIVTHPVTLAALLLARKCGIPWASVALSPVSLFSIYDPPVFTGVPFAEKLARFGPAFQRVFLKTMAFLLEPIWKPFRALEKDLGLPPLPNPLIWPPQSNLVLGLFSPVLYAPQCDWPSNAHATGFPFFEHGGGNPPELQQFLDAGEPPIVFTLGSAAVGAAGDFFEQSAEVAHSLGQRAVLLVGRDPRNLPVGKLPPGVLSVPYAPHAAVFPRASVVVHQGGIGTTGEAMRAGRPMLVVPYSHDQPDHAARLKRLGVARSIPRERYNSAVAAREIGALLREKTYADRAADIGARVRAETGLTRACDLLEDLLRKSSPAQRVLQQAGGMD